MKFSVRHCGAGLALLGLLVMSGCSQKSGGSGESFPPPQPEPAAARAAAAAAAQNTGGAPPRPPANAGKPAKSGQ